jgi:LuxR family transcriptional regulator, maltose regulon positive regulatory protein
LIIRTPRRRGVEPVASADGLVEPLTEREHQVLERLARLCTTEEIASDLFVSVNTVKTHIKSLFLKMAVNRRADAVRRGRELTLC